MTRPLRSLLAMLALAIPASPSAAQGGAPAGLQDDAPSVAIVFPDRNVVAKDAPGSDHFSTALAALIGFELSSNYVVHLADRAAVHRIAGTTPVSRALAVRIGAILGAQHALYGSFAADEAGNVRGDVHGVNVGSGAVEYTDRVQDRANNMLELVHRLTLHLAAGVHLVPRGAGHIAPIVPESIPLKSVLLYGQGLDMADRGDRAGAAAAFQSVLEDYPGFAPARAALDHLR